MHLKYWQPICTSRASRTELTFSQNTIPGRIIEVNMKFLMVLTVSLLISPHLPIATIPKLITTTVLALTPTPVPAARLSILQLYQTYATTQMLQKMMALVTTTRQAKAALHSNHHRHCRLPGFRSFTRRQSRKTLTLNQIQRS